VFLGGKEVDVTLKSHAFFFIRSFRAIAFGSFLKGKSHAPFLVILEVRHEISLYVLASFLILCPFFAVLTCRKTCLFDILPRRADKQFF